jgi:ABC-type oligopeptide transport system substrate-binding subunit
LTRNPRYWNAQEVGIGQARYRFTTSNQIAYQWFKLGEIDWSVSLIPVDVAALLQKKRDPTLRTDDYDGLFYLVLDVAKEPFNNVLVRRAIDLAIDRRRLTRQVMTQGEQPATTFVPLGMTAARPPKRLRFDPDAAKKLLSLAGYGPEKPFPKIDLLFNTNAKNKRIAEFFQRNLKENLGVELIIHNVEWKTFLERLGKHDFSMAQLILGGGFNPVGYLEMLESNTPDNRSRWSNPAFDQIVREARAATDRKSMDAAIGKAMALGDKEVPIISVYRLTRQTLLHPDLKGHVSNAENRHLLRWMSWGSK